jgi:hypothetical protein
MPDEVKADQTVGANFRHTIQTRSKDRRIIYSAIQIAGTHLLDKTLSGSLTNSYKSSPRNDFHIIRRMTHFHRCVSDSFHEFLHAYQAQLSVGYEGQKIESDHLVKWGVSSEQLARERLWFAGEFGELPNCQQTAELEKMYAYQSAPSEVFNIAIETSPDYPFGHAEQGQLSLFGS